METTAIKLLYGGAKTPYHEMSAAEKQEAAAQIVERAKEKAFSRGLPIYYAVGELVIAEFADAGRPVPPEVCSRGSTTGPALRWSLNPWCTWWRGKIVRSPLWGF